MRAIKTRPRFHCDFCSHTSTKAAMEAHERICWKNPNRHCSACGNTGFCRDDYGSGYLEEPCYWCGKVTPDSDAAELLKPKMPRLIKQLAAREEATA